MVVPAVLLGRFSTIKFARQSYVELLLSSSAFSTPERPITLRQPVTDKIMLVTHCSTLKPECAAQNGAPRERGACRRCRLSGR